METKDSAGFDFAGTYTTVAGFYEADLAAAHAAGFSDVSLAGGAVVLDALEVAGLNTGAIVDLGCGAGEWACLASERGFDVVGVDVSKAMLALARAHGSSARFVTTSLWDFALPTPVIAVTAFGEALNYGTPTLPSASDLVVLFGRIARSLAFGGVFAFDVLLSGAPMHYRSWREVGDRTILVDVNEDPTAAALVRAIQVFTREGDTYHRSEERHVVRVHRRADVEQALSEAGLSWATSAAYGDATLGARRAAYVARRRM